VSQTRVLATKLGLDGHDRGIKLIAQELRNRGAEVVYLGVGTTPAQAAAAAVAEDVDVSAASFLSGSPATHRRTLVDELASREGGDIPIVVGGLIPAGDVEDLRGLGTADVRMVGTSVGSAVDAILDAAGR
jgi:methylmalonyl-CoA mutase C-terminal domain/subunit